MADNVGNYKFDYLDDIGFYIFNLPSQPVKSYLVFGADLTPLEITASLNYVLFAPDGLSVYFFEYVDGETTNDLYAVRNAADGFTEPIHLDSNVDNDILSIWFVDNRFVFLSKNPIDSGYDLIVNWNFVTNNVQKLPRPEIIGDNNVVYFDTDNSLIFIHGANIDNISEDVHSFCVTSAGDIVFLKDFSDSSNTGTLYHYKDGKRQKLANDVSYVYTPKTFKIYGMKPFIYGW